MPRTRERGTRRYTERHCLRVFYRDDFIDRNFGSKLESRHSGRATAGRERPSRLRAGGIKRTGLYDFEGLKIPHCSNRGLNQPGGREAFEGAVRDLKRMLS